MKFNILELNRLAKKIARESKTAPTLNTGMADEHIIISAYNTMELERIIKIRRICNEVIRKKKEELAKKVGFEKYKELIAKWEQ